MRNESITLGLVEHAAEDCPAAFVERAKEVVPALRKAVLPKAFAFSAKDHGGVFAEYGTLEEIRAALPALPLHEVTLHDATDDAEVRARLADIGWLDDEQTRRQFIAEAEAGYFPGRFPNKDGDVVAGAELADYVATKHPGL